MDKIREKCVVIYSKQYVKFHVTSNLIRDKDALELTVIRFQKSFKGVSRKLQGCFKEVSRVL